MKTVDLDLIRQTLPSHATVRLVEKTARHARHIECKVQRPSLYVKGSKAEDAIIKSIMDRQRKIIGAVNVFEFFTEETGSHWKIYVKDTVDFIN